VIHTFIAPMLQEPEQNKSSVLNMCLVRCLINPYLRSPVHTVSQFRVGVAVFSC